MSSAPPMESNERGETRCVGVEIEFAGLEFEAVARLVRDRFGGALNQRDPWRITVDDTRYGSFDVALDSRHLHRDQEGLAQAASRISDELADQTSAALGALTQFVVPTEITTPPIPFPALHEVDALVDDLVAAGAKGTEESLLYAFGLHLNPEVASTDAAYLVRHIQAYILLSERLRRDVDVDVTRRVLAFADPFPAGYAALVLADGYRPDTATLIDDYLRFNPDRNREVDLLPLFAFLDEDRVRAAVLDSRIKPRPTFHYRLPNASLGRPGWSIVGEWQRWLMVEWLAAESQSLQRAREAYQLGNRPLLDRLMAGLESGWMR